MPRAACLSASSHIHPEETCSSTWKPQEYPLDDPGEPHLFSLLLLTFRCGLAHKSPSSSTLPPLVGGEVLTAAYTPAHRCRSKFACTFPSSLRLLVLDLCYSLLFILPSASAYLTSSPNPTFLSNCHHDLNLFLDFPHTPWLRQMTAPVHHPPPRTPGGTIKTSSIFFYFTQFGAT